MIQGTLKHYGIAPLFGGFMAEPAQNVLNGLHPRFGKLVEIGSMYTAVAGLLNILAIFDAYEGPALANVDEPENTGETANSPAGASPVAAGLKPEIQA